MKKSALLAVAFATCLGWMSCSSNEVNQDLQLEKNQVEVLKGKYTYVYVLYGVGGYSYNYSEDNVAEAIVERGTVKVKGLQYGTTTVTITDRLGTSSTLQIDVVQKLSEGTGYDNTVNDNSGDDGTEH